MAGEERKGAERKKSSLTVRSGAYLGGMVGQCPRGRLDATRGSLHHVTTENTASGDLTGVHIYTKIPSEKYQRHRESAGEVSSSEAIERRISERDPAPDLLGEEAASESFWWRWKGARRRAAGPRWRRRSSPESAEIAGRWRGD
jgi:hypothetical protein